MIFSLSILKILVVIALAFLLFGVPLMTFLVVLLRRRRDSSKGDGP